MSTRGGFPVLGFAIAGAAFIAGAVIMSDSSSGGSGEGSHHALGAAFDAIVGLAVFGVGIVSLLIALTYAFVWFASKDPPPPPPPPPPPEVPRAQASAIDAGDVDGAK